MKYLSGLASTVLGVLSISVPMLGGPLILIGYYIMAFGDADETSCASEDAT